jgi:hypothetical protein
VLPVPPPRLLRADFLAAVFFFAGLRLVVLRLGAAFFLRDGFLAPDFFAVDLRRFGAVLRAVFFAATVRFFAGARFLVTFFVRRVLGGISTHPRERVCREKWNAPGRWGPPLFSTGTGVRWLGGGGYPPLQTLQELLGTQQARPTFSFSSSQQHSYSN